MWPLNVAARRSPPKDGGGLVPLTKMAERRLGIGSLGPAGRALCACAAPPRGVEGSPQPAGSRDGAGMGPGQPLSLAQCMPLRAWLSALQSPLAMQMGS